MKNKPISEGYKFFAIVDARTGFVYHFVPGGRVASDKGENEALGLNEYQSSTELSKTAAMIKLLVQEATGHI